MLAEIADKMISGSTLFFLNVVAGTLLGGSFAIRPKGIRWFVFSFGVVISFYGYLISKIDDDLLSAAQVELGESYLIISKYWIVFTLGIAIFLGLLCSVFRAITDTDY